MSNHPIYLDTYTLQSDARIRLPKSAIENLHAEPGKTQFKIFYDPATSELILRTDNIDPKEETAYEVK